MGLAGFPTVRHAELLEALPLSLAKSVTRTYGSFYEDLKEVFDRIPADFRSRNGWRLFYALGPTESETSDVAERASELLDRYGWRLADWRHGFVEREVERVRKDTGESVRRTERRRLVPVLREIAREHPETAREVEDLIRSFQTDPVRRGGAAERRGRTKVVVVDFDPVEIAHMSTGRGWTSCRTVGEEGSGKDVPDEDVVPSDLVCDLKSASVVAWLTDPDDVRTIDVPSARVTLRVFDRRGHLFFVPERTVYGDAPPWFATAVGKIADEFNRRRARSRGIYVPIGRFSGDTVYPFPRLVGMNTEEFIRRLADGDEEAIADLKSLDGSFFLVVEPSVLASLAVRDPERAKRVLRVVSAHAPYPLDMVAKAMLDFVEGRPAERAIVDRDSRLHEFVYAAVRHGWRGNPVEWAMRSNSPRLAAMLAIDTGRDEDLFRMLSGKEASVFAPHLLAPRPGARTGLVDVYRRNLDPVTFVRLGVEAGRHMEPVDLVSMAKTEPGGVRHLSWMAGLALGAGRRSGAPVLDWIGRHASGKLPSRVIEEVRRVAEREGRDDVLDLFGDIVSSELSVERFREAFISGRLDDALETYGKADRTLRRLYGKVIADNPDMVVYYLRNAPADDRLETYRKLAWMVNTSGSVEASRQYRRIVRDMFRN